ncbi:DUF6131 family protein [Rhodococcus sp. WMMA185]|uniref:DUF6131 family protein n=1 Tax=Rhodococcus sp. WMMA185 TaxID=679318 RepID=UPI0018DC70D2|nr:DUF6131 family protein [Rhodococcus sp. WMMA185]
MIILGIILFVIGLPLQIPLFTTLGIILLVIGLVMALLGVMGRAVGGRKRWH